MPDFDTSTLILSIIYSLVGLSYCSYGRKKSLLYLYTGIALLIFPFFVTNLWVLLGVGLILIALPPFLNR